MMKIRFLLAVGLWLAGAGARAQGILPANNGTLDLGQTLAGVPVVGWYKVQQPLTSLTVTTGSAGFGVALVADNGDGHGTLPAASFLPSVTANCNDCWLGVQYYSQAAGSADGTLTLTWSGGGSPETVALEAQATPVAGVLVSPAAGDFGLVAVDSSTGPVLFVVTNLSVDGAAVTVESVGVSGDFALVGGGAGCAGTLAMDAACLVQVSFAPTATGERDGVLTLMTSGGTATASLVGTGVADPGVAFQPTSLSFMPGGAATQTVTVRNTGSGSLRVGAVTAPDTGFTVSSGCGALAAGASCSVVVGYMPQGAAVAATMAIPVTVGANATTYSVALNGSYGVQDAGLEVVPGIVDFGAAGTGTAGGARVVTVRNVTNEALSLVFGMPREFPLEAVTPCATLAAGASCSVAVGFLPVTGGPLTGTLTVEGTPVGGGAPVGGLGYLAGYGTAGGTLTAAGSAIPNTPVSFGEVTSGQSAEQIVTLTNTGVGPVTVRRITSEPPFLSTSTCGGVMGAGSSCNVTVTYAPVYQVTTTVGAAPRTDVAEITVESDSVSSPDEVSMTGIALPVAGMAANGAGVSALELSEGALTFGSTQVGNVSAAQTVALTNTGTTTVHVSSAAVSQDFGVSSTCGTVATGATCGFSVTFTPTTAVSAAGRAGTLEILSDAGTSLEFVSLVGVSTPAALSLTPVGLDFGTVNVGTNEGLSVVVANTGTVAVTFLGISVSGDYAVSMGSCPAVGATLGAGASCTLTVTFTPTAIGTRNGTLGLASDASQLPLTVELTGVGQAGVLTVTPGALVFGDVDVGFAGTLTVTLLNTGNAEVSGIANAIGGAEAGDFAVTVPCTVTALAPNQGCAETVRFMPSEVGIRTAMLSVASSDDAGPAVVALSGTGVSGGSFVLTVNGGSVGSETVARGSPGSFALLVTPTDGFTGNVALTCAPVSGGPDMSCSLLQSTLALGATAMSSTATISTVAAAGGVGVVVIGSLVLLPFGLARRRWRWFVGFGLIAMVGCGGGGNVTSNVRTAPAGTYQYTVTASSTGGDAVTSSVTLTLVVQ